jgi:hypothetical protein
MLMAEGERARLLSLLISHALSQRFLSDRKGSSPNWSNWTTRLLAVRLLASRATNGASIHGSTLFETQIGWALLKVLIQELKGTRAILQALGDLQYK